MVVLVFVRVRSGRQCTAQWSILTVEPVRLSTTACHLLALQPTRSRTYGGRGPSVARVPDGIAGQTIYDLDLMRNTNSLRECVVPAPDPAAM